MTKSKKTDDTVKVYSVHESNKDLIPDNDDLVIMTMGDRIVGIQSGDWIKKPIDIEEADQAEIERGTWRTPLWKVRKKSK